MQTLPQLFSDENIDINCAALDQNSAGKADPFFGAPQLDESDSKEEMDFSKFIFKTHGADQSGDSSQKQKQPNLVQDGLEKRNLTSHYIRMLSRLSESSTTDFQVTNEMDQTVNQTKESRMSDVYSDSHVIVAREDTCSPDNLQIVQISSSPENINRNHDLRRLTFGTATGTKQQ